MPFERASGSYFAKQGLTHASGFREDCVLISVFAYEEMKEWSEAKRMLIFGLGLSPEACFSKGDGNRLVERLEYMAKIKQAPEPMLTILASKSKKNLFKLSLILSRSWTVRGRPF